MQKRIQLVKDFVIYLLAEVICFLKNSDTFGREILIQAKGARSGFVGFQCGARETLEERGCRIGKDQATGRVLGC